MIFLLKLADIDGAKRRAGWGRREAGGIDNAQRTGWF